MVFADITESLNFIKHAFNLIVDKLDSVIFIYRSASFSLLDLLLAVLIFGAILPIVLVTIKNWGSGNISDYQGRERYLSRRTETREYNKRMNEIDRKYKR